MNEGRWAGGWKVSIEVKLRVWSEDVIEQRREEGRKGGRRYTCTSVPVVLLSS